MSNSDNKKVILKNQENNAIIYPFIDNLVDALFTKNLNDLIENNTRNLNNSQTHDKSVFMMFVNIYFMAYLHTQSQIENEHSITDEKKKEILKKMLSDVIGNKDKRQICVSLIKQFDPLFDINNITSSLIENNENTNLLN